MARLIRISGWSGEKRGNVVFVHGLGGHPYDTWRRRPNDGSFWPLWLAEDLPGITVFSYGYSSPPVNWLGTAMPLLDEAAHAFQVLLSNDELGTGPVTFVCHSLGGLIVKQILRIANERSGNPEVANFIARVRQVVFIATPHTGSGKANLLTRLSFVAWPSNSAKDLVANNPQLRDLNFSYRELAARRVSHLSHLVYYEMADSSLGRIVQADASDPGVPGCIPAPINADHVMIAKPLTRDELVYMQIRKFVAGLNPVPTSVGSLNICPPQPFEVDRSWSRLVPKLVRLVALVFLLLALVLGVPKLKALLDTPSKIDQLERKLDQANELIQLLASQAPQRPAPDEIKVATQQLADGVNQAQKQQDPRSQSLIQAVKAKDIEEAERLFREIASDAIRNDNNSDAATALRSEAALNRFTNVAKASELYARAAKLQPDNYDSWVDAGDTARSAGKYPDAINAYKNAERVARIGIQSNPNDLAWRQRQYRSLAEIGQVYRIQGEAQKASENYDDAARIARFLVEASPNDLGFKRDMSIALEKAGHILFDRGDYRGAMERYRESLELAKGLASPTLPYTQRDLAVAWSEVADTCIKLNDTPCAVSAYSYGADLLAGVVAANPNEQEFKTALVELYRSAGLSLAGMGMMVDAQKYFQRAREVMVPLARSDPSNAALQKDLLTLQGSYGDFLLKQRKVKEAYGAFLEEIEGGKRLVNSGAASVILLIDLSATYYQMGEIKRCQGDLDAALANFRAAVDILQGVDKSSYSTGKKNFDLSQGRVSLIKAGQYASCDDYK